MCAKASYVNGVPQEHVGAGMCIVVANVCRHLGGQAQAGQLARGILVLKHLSRCCNPYSGGGTDHLQIRIVGQKSLGYGGGLLRQVIAVFNGYQLKICVFAVAFHDCLHGVNPGILVGCLRGCGYNGPLSGASGNVIYRIHQGLADLLSTGLIGEGHTAFRIGGGVKGAYLDACCHSLLQGCLQRIGIIGRHTDGIHVLGNQGLDHRYLCICRRRFRMLDDGSAAVCLNDLLEALCLLLIVRIACSLCDQCIGSASLSIVTSLGVVASLGIVAGRGVVCRARIVPRRLIAGSSR